MQINLTVLEVIITHESIKRKEDKNYAWIFELFVYIFLHMVLNFIVKLEMMLVLLLPIL